MFWKKDRARSAPEPSDPPPVTCVRESDPELTERAMDTVADLLRVFGREAFDTERSPAEALHDHCERWAQHILVGTKEPGQTPVGVEGEKSEPEPDPDTPVRRERNWFGLRRFFADRRRDESQHVVTSFTDFREAIWAFIQVMSRSVVAEQGDDARLSHRMQRLKTAVDRNDIREIRNQALEAVQLVKQIGEERLTRRERQMQRLGDRIEAMRGQLDDVRQRADLDPLTSLHNRSAFESRLARLVDLGILFQRSACLLMVDVDHFKWVNDTYGHLAGDAVLVEISRCLERVFLRRDDLTARYGGEEFAVLIVDDARELAEQAAERLLNAVRDLEVQHEGETLRVTASIGVARLRPGETGKDWVERADRALYEAKQSGRDRYVIASEDPPAAS